MLSAKSYRVHQGKSDLYKVSMPLLDGELMAAVDAAFPGNSLAEKLETALRLALEYAEKNTKSIHAKYSHGLTDILEKPCIQNTKRYASLEKQEPDFTEADKKNLRGSTNWRYPNRLILPSHIDADTYVPYFPNHVGITWRLHDNIQKNSDSSVKRARSAREKGIKLLQESAELTFRCAEWEEYKEEAEKERGNPEYKSDFLVNRITFREYARYFLDTGLGATDNQEITDYFNVFASLIMEGDSTVKHWNSLLKTEENLHHASKIIFLSGKASVDSMFLEEHIRKAIIENKRTRIEILRLVKEERGIHINKAQSTILSSKPKYIQHFFPIAMNFYEKNREIKQCDEEHVKKGIINFISSEFCEHGFLHYSDRDGDIGFMLSKIYYLFSSHYGDRLKISNDDLIGYAHEKLIKIKDNAEQEIVSDFVSSVHTQICK